MFNKTYKVQFIRPVRVSVIVSAKSEDEACEKATELATPDDVYNWSSEADEDFHVKELPYD